MLVRIFKNSDKLIFAVIPVFGLLCWFFSSFLMRPESLINENSPVFYFFGVGELHPVFLKILTFIFSIGGAFALNYLCHHHEITEKQNSLPALFYLLYCAQLSTESVFHPMLPAGLCLILALSRFFSAYRSDNAFAIAFDASFLMSCATLIYMPLVMFLPLGLISLMILKTLRFREFLLILMGLTVPYFIAVTTWWIFSDDLVIWKGFFKNCFAPFHLPERKVGSFLIHFATLSLLIFSLAAMLAAGSGGKIKKQKIRYVFLWMMIPCLFFIFMNPLNPVFYGTIAIVLLSVFIGDFLGNMKRQGLADFLLLLFLAAFIFSNLQTGGFI